MPFPLHALRPSSSRVLLAIHPSPPRTLLPPPPHTTLGALSQLLSQPWQRSGTSANDYPIWPRHVMIINPRQRLVSLIGVAWHGCGAGFQLSAAVGEA